MFIFLRVDNYLTYQNINFSLIIQIVTKFVLLTIKNI